ncbi:MAG: type II secretion system protein [Actinobacteria bacterium]|nr:type II secretion system protein [Actinomycetota bacterium]
MGHRTPGRGESGFTLLELVVALSLFVIMSGGVFATINSGLNLARSNKNRSVAANLVAQQMDAFRAMDFATLLGQQGNHTQPIQNVGGIPFTVNTSVNPQPINSNSVPCDAASNSTNALVFRVDVSVTWPAMQGIQPATASTIISPPVGVYDQTGKGFLGVKVRGADGKPLGSVAIPVTLTPAVTPATNQTDSNGCAFFSNAAPGAYTVSLGLAGYVDRQGNPSPTQTVGVNANAITQVAFDYAPAGSFAITLAGSGGSTVPGSVPVTLGDSDFTPTGTMTVTGTGTSRTIGNLFPVSTGYTMWAGDCADADPQGASSSGPYWPGGQRASDIALSGSSPTAATITMPSVAVTVQRGGVALAGAQIQATHALPAGQTSDGGCPSGETYTVGTTDATGAINAALPYGNWTISVVGHSTVSSAPSVATLDPTGATSTSSIALQVS